jgi:hypothetical protein
MKRFPKWIFSVAFLLIVLLCIPALVRAQPNPCNDPDLPPCPIDGGLTALLAIGVGYGIKKYKNAKKTSFTRADHH